MFDRQLYLAFTMLLFGSMAKPAVSMDSEATAIVKQQDQYRLDNLPISYTAQVTFYRDGVQIKRTNYQCVYDSVSLRVTRMIGPRIGNPSNGNGNSVKSPVAIKEQFLVTPEFVFTHSVAPEVAGEAVVVNATVRTDETAQHVPAMHRYGMQLFPIPFSAAGSIRNEDPILQSGLVEPTVEKLDDERVAIRYEISSLQVERVYSLKKGFQLEKYQTSPINGQGQIQTSTFYLEHVNDAFWFPTRSIFESSIGGREVDRIETIVEKVSFKKSVPERDFTLDSFGLQEMALVSLRMGARNETRVWDGKSLVLLTSDLAASHLKPQNANDINPRIWPTVLFALGLLLVAFASMKRRRAKTEATE